MPAFFIFNLRVISETGGLKEKRFKLLYRIVMSLFFLYFGIGLFRAIKTPVGFLWLAFGVILGIRAVVLGPPAYWDQKALKPFKPTTKVQLYWSAAGIALVTAAIFLTLFWNKMIS